MSVPGSNAIDRFQATAWWQRSFRRRILTATVGGGLLALMLGVLIFGIALNRIFTVSAQQGARNQANAVVTGLAQPESNLNALLVDAQQGNSVIQVLDSDGRVLAMVGAAFTNEPISALRPRPGGYVASPEADTLNGDFDKPYAVVARGVATDSGDRVVIVAQPMALELRTVRITIALLALGGLIVLGVLLGYLTSVLDRALGRVEHIRSEVAEIHDTHSGARVQVPVGDDEFTRLARTMNAMLDRLDRADAAQRRFVSNASHELRSPLATVRAVVETGPEGLTPAATRLIAAENLRMQKLVDDLLTLARFDDAGVNLKRTEVDVDELLLDEVRRVRGMGSASISASVQPVRLEADQHRLTQAVRNLVDNALRHARSRVRLSCRFEGPWAVIDVDNDGDPVPVAEREAVFDRFTRLDAARSRDAGGSGLGLAIVKALVEAHGGSASAGETAEGWCRFELRIPSGAPQEPEPDDPQEETGPDDVTADNR